MNISKIDKIRKTIDKLHNTGISLIDLNIIYEIDSQLDKKISDDDYLKLYRGIKNAYLTLENIAIESIVECVIDNIDELLK